MLILVTCTQTCPRVTSVPDVLRDDTDRLHSSRSSPCRLTTLPTRSQTADEIRYRKGYDTCGSPQSVSDQLYANSAIGQDMRAVTAVVGEESLSEDELKYMELTESYKRHLVVWEYLTTVDVDPNIAT